jgi:hypothetical protein
MAIPYKVYIVVDRAFGEKLAGLENGVPVWIVDTPTNKIVAQRLWKERPQDSHLTGITTFVIPEMSSPEENLLGELATIDLHHGLYSAKPPYTVIEIFGAQLTEKIKGELSEYGFNEFRDTPTGFTADRPEPSEGPPPIPALTRR